MATDPASTSAIADDNAAGGVDTTPISPAKAPLDHRRDSLEKHLQLRPDAQDLKDRNILRDTNAAPSIQAAQIELAHAQTQDSLRKGLETRPTREELQARNILPANNAAPGIAGQQRDLERNMRADALEQKIARRPTAEELEEKGILKDEETS